VFEDGMLRRTLVDPGAKVPVGTVLATIDGVGAPGPPATAPPTPPARIRVSPAARQAARRLGVDLATLTGTGAGGAISVADVERAAAAGVDRAPAMRAAIAAAMARSKREIPHFYLSTTIDMTRAEAWLSAENARRPVTDRLLPAAVLLKAVALALGEVPELNGFWVDGGFRPGPGIHLGCAISLRQGGLVAPALHDVDRAPLGALMRDLRDLVARARSGSLRSSELADSTITVTNLGDAGADSTFGIIFPPQVALVGFGRIARRPLVVGDTVAVAPQLTATLSADHRAVDGHRGGLFLSALDRRLQQPEAL
jgi:pyruvate dehydrogenase E2 component (dihydrolipoamide acetyltransferase)